MRLAVADVDAYEYGAKPTLTALILSSTLQGSGAFTLQVEGSEFLKGRRRSGTGANARRTVVSAMRLSVAVSARDVAAVGVVTVAALWGGAGQPVEQPALHGHHAHADARSKAHARAEWWWWRAAAAHLPPPAVRLSGGPAAGRAQ
ncbi:MAG: hypothetical protein K6U89_05915 [Chloroflexi bacterium]|nr:hypothetical protein [Chloroflexota bacterium]